MLKIDWYTLGALNSMTTVIISPFECLATSQKNSTKFKRSLFAMVSMAPFLIVAKNEAFSTHLGVVGHEQSMRLQGCHKQREPHGNRDLVASVDV